MARSTWFVVKSRAASASTSSNIGRRLYSYAEKAFLAYYWLLAKYNTEWRGPYCTLDMNRLIQMEAAARWRLLISAAAHWVHGNAAAERIPMHPGFWLRDQQFPAGTTLRPKSGP
jgi:hypothetical protein